MNVFIELLKTSFSWRDIADISCVAVLFYNIISMMRGTRTAQILVGMLILFGAYVISELLQFQTLHWIISKFYSSIIIVIIVLFQEDIRRLLSRFGKGPFAFGNDMRADEISIDTVIASVKLLQQKKIGALIVFERSIGINKLYYHSIPLHALISEQLLLSIFQPNSPLHDGAVIIQKNKIHCASAQLPLSKNPIFSRKVGTRHSAAIGIAEASDAVILVLSEESASISIAFNGNLQRQISLSEARRILSNLLLSNAKKSMIQRKNN